MRENFFVTKMLITTKIVFGKKLVSPIIQFGTNLFDSKLQSATKIQGNMRTIIPMAKGKTNGLIWALC
mgnify:CR=1 FL=1